MVAGSRYCCDRLRIGARFVARHTVRLRTAFEDRFHKSNVAQGRVPVKIAGEDAELAGEIVGMQREFRALTKS